MFKEIMNLWRGEPLMKKAVAKFADMLSDDEFIYNQSWGIFTDDKEIDQVRKIIYEKDALVNNNEREIRRLLLEHISLRPGHDISGCMVIMSLVKDAERIGDYAKNILEVGILLGEEAKNLQHLPRLTRTYDKIAKQFPLVKKAFLESDADIASQILKDYAQIKGECNQMLPDLFSEQLSAREAIASALLSRYLKRINSHISNIASGIIYPLDQIDFVQGDILD